MLNKSSNISNEKNYSQILKTDKENIICKDGFCSIGKHHKNSRIEKEDINLFDPI